MFGFLRNVALSSLCGLPYLRFSVALSLGINGAARHAKTGPLGPNNRQPLPYFCLTLAGRTPGRNSNSRRGAACCGPPVGRRPACATLWVARATPPSSPQSIGFGLSPIPPEALRAWATRPAPLKGRKSNAPFFQVRPRRPPHAPLMRRPRRGRRPKGRTSTAQSTPQFSAPCQPHCGSAFAPPHFRRPLGFHLDFALAK